jgi:hypothetical protein
LFYSQEARASRFEKDQHSTAEASWAKEPGHRALQVVEAESGHGVFFARINFASLQLQPSHSRIIVE